MGTTEVTPHEAGTGAGANRRTVVKGFAWSVPVVAAAIAAPMSSASTGCGTNAGSFATTDPGVYNQWIPACATRVRYILRGGGGATSNAENALIGAAAEITGELALPASWAGGWLKLVVGAGGDAVEGGFAKGGAGFGRGGNGTDTSGLDKIKEWSCGGGGGSAILFGNALLAAAGGGGGSPVGVLKATENGTLLVESFVLRDTHAPSGFAFGRQNAIDPNGVGLGVRNPRADAAGAIVAPARGGVSGGAGVSGFWVSDTGNFVRTDSFAGEDGGTLGSGLNGGGNGGSGAAVQRKYTLPGETESLDGAPAGGGGGGGYHGGGGGGFAFFRETFTGFDKKAVAAASGGGAGSSFVASRVAGITVTGDVGMFREAPEQRPGHRGRVWVAWS